MAAVKEVELIVPQGTTFEYQVTYVDPDLNDAPIDISGHSARLQIRAKITDQDPLYTATSGGAGDLTLNGASGRIVLKVPSAVTAGWQFKRAVFDLELIGVSGEVTRLVKGVMILDREVTR